MSTSRPVIKSEPSPSSSSAKPSPGTPSGSYTDFILRSAPSSEKTGWKFNVMKFAAVANKSINPLDEAEFVRPLRLNRKDPRTVRRLTEQERDKIRKKAMGMIEGQNGEEKKEEAEKDGEEGETKEALDPELVGTGVSGTVAPQQRQRKAGGKFEKKIKRVFVSSEEARRLRREEWQPWVLEDDEGNARWIGRLEGGASERSLAIDQEKKRQELEKKGNASMAGWRPASEGSSNGGGGSSYVAFVFGPDGDEFQVVPIHRWYKFSQGPKYVTLGNEEAEAEYERQQKSHEAERWIMHRRNPTNIPIGQSGSAGSSGTSTPRVPLGDDGGLPPLPPSMNDVKPSIKRESSTVPSSIRSRLLDKSELSARRASGEARVAGRSKFKSVDKGGRAEVDDDELYGRKREGDGRGQDQDDDEFDYDEEFQDDEEGVAKIDDLADEQETKELEERIRKEMRGVERAPSDEEDDVDDLKELTATGKDLKRLVRKQDTDGIYDSDDDVSSSSSSDDDTKSVTSVDQERSRSSSQKPSSSSNSHGKRRESMHRTNSSSSRPHSNQASRHPSRAVSPSAASGAALVAKRATSPTRSNPGSRASSPGPGSGGGKRKRDDQEGSSKRRALSPSAGGGGGWDAPADALIEDRHLIDFFKSRDENKATTKDVLNYFRRQLKGNDKNKEAIKACLHNVASMSEKNLVLKAGL